MTNMPDDKMMPGKFTSSEIGLRESDDLVSDTSLEEICETRKNLKNVLTDEEVHDIDEVLRKAERILRKRTQAPESSSVRNIQELLDYTWPEQPRGYAFDAIANNGFVTEISQDSFGHITITIEAADPNHEMKYIREGKGVSYK